MPAKAIDCRPGSRAVPRVGVDFDNTIVSYDELMHSTAVAWGLVDADEPRHKRNIRDRLRQLPNGEDHWRRLQTFAYGEGMARATPMPGVMDFFAYCRRLALPIWIVSHKTEFNNFGPPSVNLRRAALNWLEAQGFFDEPVTGLTDQNVFFEATREEKVAKIDSLGLSLFVDDLEETFREPGFPTGVTKIHYLPHGGVSTVPEAIAAPSWSFVREYVEGLTNGSGERP